MADSLWVFGYGSLIWHPGFAFTTRQVARLSGYHRSFCMWSTHYRGTHADPGLVLALDRAEGAHCDGVAFIVPPDNTAATLAYLRERELISSAYCEMRLPVRLADGAEVMAVTYVINRDHPQYAKELSLAEQAAIIARSAGLRGRNDEYLFNTVAHLADLGISDPDMAGLAAEVRRIVAL